MLNNTTKTNLLLFISLLFGFIYLFFIDTSIQKINRSHFIINSKIEQVKRFHIRRENNQSTLQCNNQNLIFDNPRQKGYWYHGTESVDIKLQQGENHCHATHITGEVAQKANYLEFIILFLLIGTTLFHLLFKLLIFGLNQINSNSKKDKASFKWIESKFFDSKLILTIILLGIIIRVLYFEKYGIMLFQHDWHGHIEFIKYMSNTWSLPIPTKGLEYPQQPLYYFISGNLYSILNSMEYNESERLLGIGFISLLSSIIFLIYGYKILNLLTQNHFVKVIAILFMTLTPSLVYISARINNDALLIALASLTLYYSIKSFQSQFKNHFYLALTLVSLLFLTKISSAGFELFLFTLLLIAHHQAKNTQKDFIAKKLYIFSFITVLLLSFTLLRLYLPLEGSFYMVNSSANYPNQSIKDLDLSYFGSFHIIELIKAGQSYVFGEDSIRYSFLTYQYGTMLFGEFDYQYFVKKITFLHLNMQFIIVFALLYVLGFTSYLINLKRESLISKLVFSILIINLLLILKFMLEYSSICNTDFRYFVSSFVVFSFIVAQGLSHLTLLRKPIAIILGLLALSEIVFFIALLK